MLRGLIFLCKSAGKTELLYVSKQADGEPEVFHSVQGEGISAGLQTFGGNGWRAADPTKGPD